MAIALSTAGISLGYCAETTKGTRPTSGYTVVANVKSLPAVGDEVNALQTTDLSAEKSHSYIAGLRDSGGSMQCTANLSDELQTAWETAVSAYGALTGGKAMWWEFKIPGMTKSFFIPGQPVGLGFSGAEVDSVLEATLNILPTGDYEWATASTVSP